MEASRETMSKDAELAFKGFSKNISYCIFNRILGMVSLLLIIASCACLLLCYWLLTGSKYVEHIMVNICADMDLFYFQRLANDTIQTVTDKVNNWTGSRDFVSKTNIKREFASMLERHLAPDWANEVDEVDEDSDNSSDDEDYDNEDYDNEDYDNEDYDNEESYNEESDDEESDDEESDDELSNINRNLEEQFDNEVEDVTEQVQAEREANISVLNLVSDEEEVEDDIEQVAEIEVNNLVSDED
jgi:hypothetical protein